MPYLKAVILEGLRRHPPGHFVLPHRVKEDTLLGDYLVPKDGTINFMVADIGWDPMGDEDDAFCAGRRICPGFGLALLHLEYFVANLIWRFEWKAVGGDEISLEEMQNFTVVMKNPLMAHISTRNI
ncbi:Cytochrome P450, family 87, subfamily A, polypeptide 6 [Hibiscus syriacus]|uniref:Cytochrome P450, family 87, subfamily A, polypeptide 6 n=1 Tax=Hibiscus syriacus TaxID=106335 RepID=A0A6A2XIA2_HIBSY|nr:Cytochrome P450, family 87, subfamily A, polypeptide 6 [Hibiscus syriacus]